MSPPVDDENAAICRSCLFPLTPKDTSDMYGQSDVHQMYKKLCQIEVSRKGGLPHSFCLVCRATLIQFHGFRDRCIRNEQSLQESHRIQYINEECLKISSNVSNRFHPIVPYIRLVPLRDASKSIERPKKPLHKPISLKSEPLSDLVIYKEIASDQKGRVDEFLWNHVSGNGCSLQVVEPPDDFRLERKGRKRLHKPIHEPGVSIVKQERIRHKPIQQSNSVKKENVDY